MWALENRTAYKAERTWLQDVDGGKRWIVVVKGTFDILPNGETRVAEEQVDPLLAPEYLGEDGASSLRYESDLIPPKPGTDVYVNGSAYAPGGVPATRVSVGLRIGGRPLKVLDVVGDRTYESDLGRAVPSSPRPFVDKPLVYERAYGGYDNVDPSPLKQVLHASNPVGCGVARMAGRLLGRPAPNLRRPGGGERETVGYGAVASYWAPRMAFGGTYDAKWVTDRKPLLPLDFDPRFHMCAPQDQQFIPHLRGGERIELANMTPSGGLSFDIPKRFIGMSTAFSTREEAVRHRAVLHTVIVEPDVPRVIVVWHGSLRCQREADFLDETTITEKEYTRL